MDPAFEYTLYGGQAHDRRCDQDANAELLNIIYQSGTFGNFMKIFIDKFSKKTPDITKSPFTEIGQSHNLTEKDYSGKVQKYHFSFVNDNQGKENLNVCVIVPEGDQAYQYLELGQWYRAGFKTYKPDQLWQKDIKELKQSPQFKNHLENIIDLYKIKTVRIPKYLVRDFYKIGYLADKETSFNYRLYKYIKEHSFFGKQTTHHFPLDAFFNYDAFQQAILMLDDFFKLELNWDRSGEMQMMFNKGLELDKCRHESNMVFTILSNIKTDINMPIPKLDITSEAFINAYIEKNYEYIITPMTNHFYKDTDEIREFVKCYPQQYKKMNPHLPKFRGYPNPSYIGKN